MTEFSSVPFTSPAPAAPPAAPTETNVAVTSQPGGKTTKVEFSPAGAPVIPDQRPPSLPEKFKTVEDLAKAYGELERRMGSGQPAIPAAPAAQAPAPAPVEGMRLPEGAPAAPVAPEPVGPDIVAQMTQEYAQTGQISEASRQAFAKQYPRLPPSYIDNQVAYMRGQEQQASQIAMQRLGGEGAVRELIDWAATNLSEADRKAFNQAAYSSDQAMVNLAIDGLAAKYESAVGRAPRVIAGRKPQSQFGGAVPFQSHAEWTAARRDPRYKTDPAYRDALAERVRASFSLGTLE